MRRPVLQLLAFRKFIRSVSYACVSVHVSIKVVRCSSVPLKGSSEILIVAMDWMMTIIVTCMITKVMVWMIKIISLDIVVFNSKMFLSLNDVPQLIIIMLKITHQILSMVLFYVVRVVMVRLLDHYVMVP
jgi:hypothetical protein